MKKTYTTPRIDVHECTLEHPIQGSLGTRDSFARRMQLLILDEMANEEGWDDNDDWLLQDRLITPDNESDVWSWNLSQETY